MIVKWYKREGTGFYGQNIDSWTDSWMRTRDLAKSFAHADKDYLAPFFKRYFPRPPQIILEGGCGIAKYVVAYRRLGYDIRGVDFSRQTIQRLKEIDSTLPIEEADITALPYPDGFFDCYYSGGIVEHFEEGPTKALLEARRVLKRGAILIATVPYINILRRLHFCIVSSKRGTQFLQMRRRRCQVEPPPAGFAFSEYLFDVSAIRPFFEENGFHLEEIVPTDFLWGELGVLLQRLRGGHLDPARSMYDQTTHVTNVREEPKRQGSLRAFMYDFLVTENRDRLIIRVPLTILNHLSGHMVLFVARAV